MDSHNDQNNLALATLGTGCFWCTEAIFQNLDGVKSAISGYSGGHIENPTYEEICTATTGHAECVQITYDSSVINFEELLEVFWRVHDPTTPNQQGNDIGPQYRSAIFYHDDIQKSIAEKSIVEVNSSDLWPNPIVTEIAPFQKFFKAEEQHQKYFDRVGTRNPYCTFIIAPKLEKFKKEFEGKLKISE